MKTILLSWATTETAGPSAEVRVPTRKSTLSFRMSSRAWRTASLASALESRTMSSSLRPSTPPLALISSTNIWAPLDAGSPKSAGGPESGMGIPTLIGFCASATGGISSARARATVRIVRRCMGLLLVGMRLRSMPSEHRQAGNGSAQPVERRRGGDEQRAQIVVAPREVRGVLGHLQHLEQARVGVEDVDAPRTAAVHVPGAVELHAVGSAGLGPLRLRPHPAVGEAAVRRHVEHADVLSRSVVDEQPPLVQGEAEPVGPVEVVHQQPRRPGVGAHPVYPLEGQFLRALDAVELRAAVRRIGEVDGAVRLANDVVGAVELLAVIVRRDRHDAAVGLRARDLTAGVLTGQQPALAVVGEAVRLVARLAERRDTVGGRPAAHVIARHVAE